MTADFPDVRQLWKHDCGAACLMAVLRHFRGEAAVEDERIARLAGREDLDTAFAIIRFAQELSLDAAGVAAAARSLDAGSLPAILHWNGNHFVVLFGTGDDGALILDPAVGKAHYAWDAVERHHTGVTVLFGAAARRVQETAR